MRVISKARLMRFWEIPGRTDGEGPLRAWYTHVNSKTVAWHSWGDLKAAFRTASLVGNCVVFNIGGNKYRLIARVDFEEQLLVIQTVLTHQEYDREDL